MENELLVELLQLSQNKEIPYTQSQLKKMSHEKLEEVMQEYKLKELDALNETQTDVAIIKIEEYSKSFNLIKEDSQLARKLQDRKLFRRDLKSLVSYITPILPYVGILEGVVVYGIEVIEKFAEKRKENKNDRSPKDEKGDQQSKTRASSSQHTQKSNA